MNEINTLIWPARWRCRRHERQGVHSHRDEIAKQFKVIKKAPSGAYRTDLAKGALVLLKKQGVDVDRRELQAA